LKTEELEKNGLFKDERGYLYFNCQSCLQLVRIRKEDKKKKKKGTEHLIKELLCQIYFDF
jgi:hypothetical protein